MLTVRPSEERGAFDHGWLDTKHTFSFADYQDPRHMGFRSLRVINEDVVAPGKGFGTHGHRDIEIITYVLDGALQHRDSMGNGSIIRPGDVQRMTAGTGVTHSEFNPSAGEQVHLLQIWILPERSGLPPGYEQRTFSADERRGRLKLVASRNARDGSLAVHQDADLFAALLSPGQELVHALGPKRHAWVQVARGALAVNGTEVAAGDGVALSEEPRVVLRAEQPTEILLFDLA